MINKETKSMKIKYVVKAVDIVRMKPRFISIDERQATMIIKAYGLAIITKAGLRYTYKGRKKIPYILLSLEHLKGGFNESEIKTLIKPSSIFRLWHKKH